MAPVSTECPLNSIQATRPIPQGGQTAKAGICPHCRGRATIYLVAVVYPAPGIQQWAECWGPSVARDERGWTRSRPGKSCGKFRLGNEGPQTKQ